MSVDVTRADRDTIERWDGHVERSPQGNVFHQYDALRVQAAHANAELHPLIGHKGEEPVGLFPVFEIRKGPIRTAFSPPPDLRVPYLGPALLDMEKLKQRKAEKRRNRFVEGCLEWIEEEIAPAYTHVRTDGRYDDPRPFQWNGCEVSVDHTYLVDLTPGEEDVLMRFSSDARRNIRNGADVEYAIEERGVDAIRDIVSQVRERYESQGIQYRLDAEFVVDLYRRLPDGNVRPYVCTVDDEFVGGLLALEYGDTVYRWQGGVRTGTDLDLSVNDLLDWQVMKDAMDRGLARYDLVGADDRRINRYKAKFGPELAAYHGVTRSTRVANAAARLYKRLH